jgi:hypothetical protein
LTAYRPGTDAPALFDGSTAFFAAGEQPAKCGCEQHAKHRAPVLDERNVDRELAVASGRRRSVSAMGLA